LVALSTIPENIDALIKSRPEQAKDLLSAAIRRLSGDERDVAKVKLALTYKWAGELSEGLAIVNDLLSGQISDEVRFRALLAKATLQIGTPKAALLTLNQAEPYIQSVDLRLRGMWHNQRGRTLKELKLYDQAVIEYAGAASFFEEAGDPACAAIALNNEAGVFLKWGKYDEALEAVRSASATLKALEDPTVLHFQDQEAQILIAKGQPKEAKQLIDRVIANVESGDKKELLLECLLTRGRALSALGLPVLALQDIEKAEGISEYLSRPDLRLTVAKTKKDITASMASQSHIEAVELALEQSNGAVRSAAQKLGISHASLISFIKTHNLERKPARRTSIFRASVEK
jgi:tetratricopeptide (TPR) repeat protein